MPTDPNRAESLFHRALALPPDARSAFLDGACAGDVRRYLAGEPVQAVPPSTGYRLRKFLRRNRGAVTAAGVVLLALAAGIAGTGWGLVEARRHWDHAEYQRQEAEAARALEAAQRAKVEEQKSDLERQKALLEEQKKAAEAARHEAAGELHDNQRTLFLQAWEAGERPRVRAVLDQMRPKPGRRTSAGSRPTT